MPAAAERTLIIGARDLDTDERSVATVEVEMPAEEVGQRAQLAEAVGRLHPEARMRSFGSGAGSFLGSQRLVVAHYGRATERSAHGGTSPRSDVEQQPLFAS